MHEGLPSGSQTLATTVCEGTEPEMDSTDTAAATHGPDDDSEASGESKTRLKKKVYEAELARLQLELVKMEDWVKAKRLRVVVLFEAATPLARVASSNGSWMA